MTEKEVQLLGFEKEIYDKWWDDDGNTGSNHYYSYEITNGMSFISSASDEAEKDGQWYIDVFNTQDPIRFWKFEEVQNLLNILEKHLIK
jgi:hypothetical protein